MNGMLREQVAPKILGGLSANIIRVAPVKAQDTGLEAQKIGIETEKLCEWSLPGRR